MSWQKKRKRQGKNRYYSLSKKLRREQRSNDTFEVMLSQLTTVLQNPKGERKWPKT